MVFSHGISEMAKAADAPVMARLPHQFSVGADLHDPAFVQHHNEVRPT